MSDYYLLDSDAHTVAKLCEALDGIPLAIEIAAAKLHQFSPGELLDSIGRRFSELRNRDEAKHSRQQTLWATFDWSYHLLSMQESTIFRLLSVFAGSFGWSDVAGMARLVNYDPYQTTMALGGLVAKSLLSAEIDGDHLRYRLLQSTRTYAAERLLQDPLSENVQRHHAQIVLSAFLKSETEWSWVDNRVWRTRYGARIGDLSKALDWCFGDEGDASLGVDLVISALRLWSEQSAINEQRTQVERALKHCVSEGDAPQRKAVLATFWAWGMTLGRQLHSATDDAWMNALTLAELSNDLGQQLSVIFGYALFLIYTGRNEEALSRLVVFNQVAARANDRGSLIDGERLGALAEMHLGQLVSVRAKLERFAVELSHGMPPSRIGRYQEERYVGIHSILAFSTWLTGRPESGLAMVEELVMKTGQIGQLMGQSHVIALYALPLALLSGDTESLARYASILSGNLDREHIAIWEPVHRFYASFGPRAPGRLRAADDMRLSIDELLRDNLTVRTPMYLAVLSEAFCALGDLVNAVEAIESALALQFRSKENWCLPELLRVRAQITAACGDITNSRTILGKARGEAVKIGARTLELRIVNDLAHMAIIEGNSAAAVELLEPVYESFRQKSATADLKRSANLLTAAGVRGT